LGGTCLGGCKFIKFLIAILKSGQNAGEIIAFCRRFKSNSIISMGIAYLKKLNWFGLFYLFLSLFCVLILQTNISAAEVKNKTASQREELNSSEYHLLELVNKERKKAGLSLFVMDSLLQKVARAHSADMVKKDFFSHKNPDGQNPFDRMKKAGVVFMAAAENIAYNASVVEIHKALMKSPGHRANIMNSKLGRIGIGLVPFKYGLMATQVFKNP